MSVVAPPWLGAEVVVSGLFAGTELTGILLEEMTGTPVAEVIGYTVTEVRTGQLVTSGGHLVIVIVSVV